MSSIDEMLGLPGARPNRIVQAIERTRAAVAAAKAEGKDLAAADTAARLEFDEYVVFQDLKSQAQASGFITLEEAQTVYAALEGGAEAFGRNDLGARIALVKFLSELLKLKTAGKL